MPELDVHAVALVCPNEWNVRCGSLGPGCGCGCGCGWKMVVE